MLKKPAIKKDLFFLDTAIYGIALAVAGFVLPLILMPIIRFTGYSEIVEGIAKSVVVLLVALKLPSTKLKIAGAAAFGFLFGVSENIFYLNNFFQLGNFDFFWQRFFWTAPMHAAATLIVVLSGLAGKWWWVLGALGGMALHLLFNFFVA